MNVAVLCALGLVCFAAFVIACERYDRAAWRPPAGSENANWARRFKVAISCGALGVCACALFTSRTLHAPVVQILLVVQAALMAAAGATDIHKYRLPLPATLGGIALTALTAYFGAAPPMLLALGLGWAGLITVANIVLTRGRMGWGDHIAMLWLGLAAPQTGLLAVVIGQCAVAGAVRLSGWGRRPVPIGGAWLLAGALVLALPSLPARPNTPVAAASMRAAEQMLRAGVNSATAGSASDYKLLALLEQAGDATAAVAFARNRRAAARIAAGQVRVIHRGLPVASDADVVETSRILAVLAAALDSYDMAAIAVANDARADLVTRLSFGADSQGRYE